METTENLKAKKKNKLCSQRLPTLLAGYLLFCFLFTSHIYHNVTLTTKDNGVIKIKEAIYNLRQSTEWKQFVAQLYQIWERSKREGFSKMYDNFMNSMDVDGTERALKTLGLKGDLPKDGLGAKSDKPTLTFADIKHARNKLALQYHPDKQKDATEEERTLAANKFREIQNAYEILERVYERQSSKNNKNKNKSET